MLVKEAGPGAFRTSNTASASASLTSAILARSAGSSGRSAPQSRQSVCSGPSTSASPPNAAGARREPGAALAVRAVHARGPVRHLGRGELARLLHPQPTIQVRAGRGKGAVAGTPPGRSGRFGGTPRVSPRAPPSCTSDSLLDRSWSEIMSEVPSVYFGALLKTRCTSRPSFNEKMVEKCIDFPKVQRAFCGAPKFERCGEPAVSHRSFHDAQRPRNAPKCPRRTEAPYRAEVSKHTVPAWCTEFSMSRFFQ